MKNLVYFMFIGLILLSFNIHADENENESKKKFPRRTCGR